jgi:hypothetical protein
VIDGELRRVRPYNPAVLKTLVVPDARKGDTSDLGLRPR